MRCPRCHLPAVKSWVLGQVPLQMCACLQDPPQFADDEGGVPASLFTRRMINRNGWSWFRMALWRASRS